MIVNIAALIYVSAAFGISFPLIKLAEETITPLTVQSLRATFGFLFMFILSLILRRDIIGHARFWFAFLIFGVLGIAYLWIVVALGEEYISAGLTSVLVSVTPMATFIITVFILREEPFSVVGLTGLIVGVVGLVLVIGVNNILSSGSTLTGILLVVSGFLVFAVNGVLAPRLATDTDPIVSTTYYTGIGTLIMWVFTFAFESPLRSPINEENIFLELFMGIICFASAFVVYYWLLNRAGAFFSSLTFYLVPIMGTVGSYFILNEKMDKTQVLGIFIVFIGVYLINRTKFKKV